MGERGRSSGEYYHRRERKGEPPSYHRSARFSGEQPAGQAHEAAQEAIYSGSPNDLSVYRLILNQVWHASVLGQTPPPELKQQLEDILSTGESAELPTEVLQALQDRRVQSIRRAPWSERHFR